MFFVYIIHSTKTDGYYCGQTIDLINRLSEHNSGETKSIKNGIPWILVGYLVFLTRQEAVLNEKKIKARGIKRWLEYSANILNNNLNFSR